MERTTVTLTVALLALSLPSQVLAAPQCFEASGTVTDVGFVPDVDPDVTVGQEVKFRVEYDTSAAFHTYDGANADAFYIPVTDYDLLYTFDNGVVFPESPVVSNTVIFVAAHVITYAGNDGNTGAYARFSGPGMHAGDGTLPVDPALDVATTMGGTVDVSAGNYTFRYADIEFQSVRSCLEPTLSDVPDLIDDAKVEIDGFDPILVDAPNNNAAAGRLGAMSNHLDNALVAIADEDYVAAERELNALISKIDRWLDPMAQETTDLRASIQVILDLVISAQ